METAKWPKVLPPMTPEQKRISDEFMKLWHEQLPTRYGFVEKFNHSFPGEAFAPGLPGDDRDRRRSWASTSTTRS